MNHELLAAIRTEAERVCPELLDNDQVSGIPMPAVTPQETLGVLQSLPDRAGIHATLSALYRVAGETPPWQSPPNAPNA